MTVGVGTRLGSYEIVAALGAGGMGEVYRARDTKLGRDVALKVLPTEFALDAERRARFKREAQVLASLNDPHIAAIYGFEDADGVHALVLELVEGPTLADRIAQGPISIDEALPVARQIAEALEAAHEQGIIHRDLKPANIKVRPDGTVKVLDFGLAKLADAGAGQSGGAGKAGEAGGFALSQSPTITTPAHLRPGYGGQAVTLMGTILGTAAYMSPEQAKGRPADKRSDIWAFGCVLYEMLTGKRAFEGEDVSDTLASVLRSEPDWTAVPGDVPVAIRVLVERCLAKDRRQRVGDVSTARFVLNETLSLVSTSEGARETRSGRISPISIGVGVLVAVLLAAAAGWSLRPAAARPTVTRFWLKLSEDEQQLAIGGRQVLAISPDGTRTVHSAKQQLWLRTLSDFGSRAITIAPTIGLHSPVFSPDGQSVAFYSGNTMKRMGVIGDAPVALCAVDAPFGVTWDASGIIVGQGSKGIVRCSPRGGPTEQLATVQPDEQAHGPQMLPDGRHLLFTIAKTTGADSGFTRWDQAHIVIQDLKSGQRKTAVTGGSDGRYVPTGHLLYAIGGVILAVPFDLRTLETTSAALPVLEGVARARSTTGVAQMAVSNSGTLLYEPGPASPSSNIRQVALADRAGVVTPLLKLPPGPYVHARASRDGKRLALGSDDGKEAIVWIYDLAGTSAVRRLTLDGRNRFPIWSPDGESVAFQSDREGDLAIFTQRIDGTGAAERLTKPEKDETHVPGSWSGTSLAFSVSKDRSLALWTVSIPGKKTAPFGNVVSAEAIEPTFSPDGRWIAYSAAPPGTGPSSSRGIYIQPFPATGSKSQAPKQLLDFQPVWSPDGRELFYVPSAASGRLAAVRVTTQAGVTFSAPEILPAKVTADRTSNEPRAFDILPDGHFVGLIGSGTDAPGQVELRIVLNWFEELKQKVPTGR